MQTIAKVLTQHKIQKETILHMLQLSLDLEYINQQAYEAVGDKNKSIDCEIRILQTERFLCLLRKNTTLD
jgi:hypothetical protein